MSTRRIGWVLLFWVGRVRRGREGGGERKTGAPEEGKSTRLVKSQVLDRKLVRKTGCVPAIKVLATQQLHAWAVELGGHRLRPGLAPAALNPNTQGHPLSGKSTEGCHHEPGDHVSGSRSIGYGSLKKTMVGRSLFTLFPIRKKTTGAFDAHRSPRTPPTGHGSSPCLNP